MFILARCLGLYRFKVCIFIPSVRLLEQALQFLFVDGAMKVLEFVTHRWRIKEINLGL